MKRLQNLIERYVELWNEADAERRRNTVENCGLPVAPTTPKLLKPSATCDASRLREAASCSPLPTGP